MCATTTTEEQSQASRPGGRSASLRAPTAWLCSQVQVPSIPHAPSMILKGLLFDFPHHETASHSSQVYIRTTKPTWRIVQLVGLLSCMWQPKFDSQHPIRFSDTEPGALRNPHPPKTKRIMKGGKGSSVSTTQMCKCPLREVQSVGLLM